MKNKILILLLLLIGSWQTVAAQDNDPEKTIEVTGTITDEHKETLIGANVTVKDMPGFGTVTDVNGKYRIKMPPYSRLIFSYIGYESQEVLVKENHVVNVVLKESKQNILNEVTVTGTGVQKKISITGAVTTVDVDQLKTSGSSVTNALAGNVPGILAMQTSGQPGDNVSEFWIRGISTFGAGAQALVLVDGFERDINELNIEDIQSFTVLKDASATAIYGSRGANGVVLITTKHGAKGKVHINAKLETTYNTRTRTPEFVDGLTYATLMNEARTTRNQRPFYTEDDLSLIQNGLDPDLYPNVDWMGMILKKGAPTYRASLNMNGGGTLARYYISAAYIDEGGMYETDKALKDYSTNANYRRWNYRMNVDLNITKSTLIKVGVSGSLGKQNQPGALYDEIWGSLMGQNPVSIPVRYSNGYMSSRGGGYKNNPWVLLTQSGYTETWNNKIQTTVNLEQNLNFLTKGLKFYGRYGYDTYGNNYNRRSKVPEGWEAERQRNSDGDLVFTRRVAEQMMESDPKSTGERREYLEAELHYNRTFRYHQVGAVLKYAQDKYIDTSENPGKDMIQGIDKRHQGLAGRLTYGWKNRYFFDFNFGYNGSENFATGHQFGFFPAYSAAWNIAEEPFAQKHLKWMNMFKLRYSFGKVGNDYIGDNNRSIRFPYLSYFKNDTKQGSKWNDIYGYHYGDIGNSNYYYTGLTFSTVGSTGVTWEKATKHDVGLDFSLFEDRFSGTIDYFHEQRDGIYMSRNYLAPSIGLTELDKNPSANIGSVLSKGFDGNVAWMQKFGKVTVTIRGNMTYSKNEILAYDEKYSHYDYTRYAGFRVNQARGLIAEGLFSSYEEIRNSPRQRYGTVMPGDIKYKDVNGDGEVNNDDIVPIGATTKPNMVYGFGASAGWNGFDFNMLFQGTGKSSFFINGYTVYPFSQGDWGNILTDMPGNYWSLGTNEDPDAKYPRLSYGGNENNYRPSTFWLRDGSYLRLKTLELGYTLPKELVNGLQINNVRIYFRGTNLLTFSDFKLWDPELGSSNGQRYPLSKSYTLGLTVNL